MKLISLVSAQLLLAVAVLGGPTNRRSFANGNSGTSGRAGGDETQVESQSKVQAGEETGPFAQSRGFGRARGRGESTVDLESWAGFDGWQTGGAGGRGRALGDDTEVDTETDMFVGEGGSNARSKIFGGARGFGQSAIDLEAFGALDGWSSGSAGGGGKAVGDKTKVDSEASVNTETGKGTLAKSMSEGGAQGETQVGQLNLENFAGVDETNTHGRASVTAIGNRAMGRSGASSLHGADGEILVGSETEAKAEANRRGGIRLKAESTDGGFFVRAGADGRGEGDSVVSGGNSKTGLSNSERAGQASSFSRSSGRGSSFSESGASLAIGESKPELQSPPESVQQ